MSNFIKLTAHDGGPIWVERNNVSAIDRHVDPKTPTTIFVSGNIFYVQESAHDVLEKLMKLEASCRPTSKGD